MLELSDYPELTNAKFGDLIGVIELYNRIIPLYTMGKFTLEKSKRRKKEVVDENKDIDETVLEYESFLSMLKNDNNDTQKKAFLNIVKNLLTILLKHADYYTVNMKLFGILQSFS